MDTTDPKIAVTDFSTECPKDLCNLHQRRTNASTHLKPHRNEIANLQPLAQSNPEKRYRHAAVVHSVPRTSCLSHESQVAPSFLGFRNLMVLVLIVGNLRLMMENFKKDILLGIALLLVIPCHLFLAYIVELIAAQQARSSVQSKKDREGTATPGGSYIASEKEKREFKKTWQVVAWIHGLNASLCLLITSIVVYFFIHHPLIGSLIEVHALIVWLKTASYALTNRDLRDAYLHPSKRDQDSMPDLYEKCPYPCNITLSNLVYFWWAPTLVYQPIYPRTPKIRWVFVAKRMAEVFSLNAFMWIASVQYAAPVLRNSLDKMATLDLLSILERLMKLSTISLMIWLAGFFALFQSYLNAIAEITRFGDREFYRDWWNSPSVGVYWRTWNKPVYHFMKRHIYMPLISRGGSVMKANLIVFLFSAILHEILVGIPTHNFTGSVPKSLSSWGLNFHVLLIIVGVAFIGMMLQLPLVFITAPLEKMKGINGKILGNCIFWISFTLIGQPLAALLYFFAWEAKYGSASRQAGTFKTY